MSSAITTSYTGKGYKHRDHDFKTLLNQVGGSRYCQVVPGQRRTEKWKHSYKCLNAAPYIIGKGELILRGLCVGNVEANSSKLLESNY